MNVGKSGAEMRVPPVRSRAVLEQAPNWTSILGMNSKVDSGSRAAQAATPERGGAVEIPPQEVRDAWAVGEEDRD